MDQININYFYHYANFTDPRSGHASLSSAKKAPVPAPVPVTQHDKDDPVILQKAPMSIRFPLENAWDNRMGTRTPRSARSTRSAASTRTPTPMYEHMVVTSEED